MSASSGFTPDEAAWRWQGRSEDANGGCDATALDRARVFRPEVVVCDIALAGPMDGHAVAAAIRRDPLLQSPN